MRKKVYLFLCLILGIFMYPVNIVLAETDSQYVSVCEYVDENNNSLVRIYYSLYNTFDSTGNIWNVTYNGDFLGYTSYVWCGADCGFQTQYIPESTGKFENVFITSERIHYQEENRFMTIDLEDNFKCPSRAFANLPWNIIDGNSDELCFSDYQTCGADFVDAGPYQLAQNGSTIFEVIDNYSNETVYNEIALDEFKTADLVVIIKDKTNNYISQKYSLGTTYTMPNFIKNYIDKLNLQETEAYKKFKERIIQEINLELSNGTISEEEAARLKEQFATTEQKFKPIMTVNPSDDPNCDGLLGKQMTKIINNLFKFIRYLGPVLVAVFAIVDFFKAFVSGESSDVNKATQKLSKRAICAILLFFIPLVVSIIFNIAGVTVPEFCID